MKIPNTLRSRTVLAVILLFVIGGIQAISDFLPQSIYLLVEGILSLFAIYFRVKPRVNFNE